MKKVIEIDYVISTKECVEELNKHIKKDNWKRLSKFNIKVEYPGYPSLTTNDDCRVFTNGTEIFTIINSEDGCFIFDYDLSKIKELITKIQDVAETLYTHDYGDIYLNPFNMSLYIVGGDGGVIQSDLSNIKDIIEEYENNDDINLHEKVCNKVKDLIPEITHAQIEAECSPHMNTYLLDKDHYIFVARCSLLEPIDED